ncbi:MAG: mandelate racemase/muconate lactonizing enzyme family protein [Candidatus Sumerlaeia bacterium]|nr:mandelate racemase/muconate lactonizing enzyme family protein [Candidatus Sumerlaeia bacterium]
MKITRVESFLMSCPLDPPLKLLFWGGERTILKRDALLIRVVMDNGLTGYAPGPAHERATQQIHDVIAPCLAGRDPRRCSDFGFQFDLPTRKTYRAVEIALLDALARYEGCPLSELMGGRKRNAIKLYGSAGMYMAPERYAQEAAAIAAMGFPAYKMRAGLGPDADLKTVELMRRAIGPDIGLMIDAHTWWRMGDRSYPFDTVQALSECMAAYHPVWLEEPLPPEDHAAYRQLRNRSGVKLASGEHEPDDAGFLDLIASEAVDYVQMDLFCQGGLPTARRVFESVQQKELRFAFHSWGTALEVLTAAHLGICWPETVVEWLEYPCYSKPGRAGMYPFPLSDEILNEPLEIRDGHLIVPDGPGLGIAINEKVIETYRPIPGPWSFFRLDSPTETIAVIGDHSVKWVGEAGR